VDGREGAPGPAGPAPGREAVELGAALRLFVGRIARRTRQVKAGVGDLSLSQASALARLERDGPESPGRLAAAEGVRPQAMAVTVAALEKKGLISRTTHPVDRRRAVVEPTEAGRRVVTERRSVVVRQLAATLQAEFTPEERERLHAVLPLLDRLAERL